MTFVPKGGERAYKHKSQGTWNNYSRTKTVVEETIKSQACEASIQYYKMDHINGKRILTNLQYGFPRDSVADYYFSICF